MKNYDSEIERRSHPENFDPTDFECSDEGYASVKDWEESENE